MAEVDAICVPGPLGAAMAGKQGDGGAADGGSHRAVVGAEAWQAAEKGPRVIGVVEVGGIG